MFSSSRSLRAVCPAALIACGLLAASTTPAAASTTATCPGAGNSCLAAIGDDYPYRSAVMDGGFGYGGYYRECTDFVAWRLNRDGASGWYNWGNADRWDDTARSRGIRVDRTPALGAVAQWDSMHVAYVAGYNADRSQVFIEEYNREYNGTYGSRWIPAGSPTNYIHVHDLSTPVTGSTIGSLDGAVGLVGGGAFVRGWALDPDTTEAIELHLYVDGGPGSGARGESLGLASLSRPDVDAVHHMGASHGFSTGISGLSPGAHTLYLYGINAAGSGDNTKFGEARINVPAPSAGSPVGSADAAHGALGGIAVSGWAFDPDSPALPVGMHAYLDGPAGTDYYGFDLGEAKASRPDIAAIYPSAGASHGLDKVFGTVEPGPHSVFLYALNRSGSGDNPLLGILRTTVGGGSPVGVLESALGGTNFVVVRGWAVDPDAATAPVTVHFYLDGPADGSRAGRDLGEAKLDRPDIGAMHPAAGAAHGFSAVVAGIPAGSHSVFVYALNRAGSGGNTLLGQTTATVTNPPPAQPAPSQSQTQTPHVAETTTEPTPGNGAPTLPTTQGSPPASAQPETSTPPALPATRGDTRPIPAIIALAASKASKLRVDLTDLSDQAYWKFAVQKLGKDGSWKTWKWFKSAGKKELRTVNPKKGTYRVLVPEQRGYQATVSASVSLRK